MNSLFVGLLFLFLNFSLKMGTIQIGLLPDFLGYLLLLHGLRRMAGEGARFAHLPPLVLRFAIYTALVYLLELGGLSARLGVLDRLLQVACTVMRLYVSYELMQGMADLERRDGCDYAASGLRLAWTALAVSNMLNYLLLFNSVLGTLCALFALAAGIAYLIAFYHCRQRYAGWD